MEASRYGSHTGHKSHGGHRRHKKRFKIKFFNRFRRFDEYGFVNPEYDKIRLAIGKFVMSLIAIAFIVLLLLCYLESFPSNSVY